MIAAAVSAELLKVRKRPAVWTGAAALAAILLVLFYGIIYALVSTVPPDQLDGMDPAELVAMLLPSAMAASLVGNGADTGGVVALVLGALVGGNEYGWRTVRTMATQGPSRAALMVAKAVATVAVGLLLAVAALVAVAAGSQAVAAVEGASQVPSAASDVALAFLATWLILTVWGAVGLALGVALRGTGLAIGVGLGYAFGVETVFAVVPSTVAGVELAQRALLGQNAAALVRPFDGSVQFGGQLAAADIAPGAAVAVLVAYGLAAVGLATWSFHRREVP